MFYIPEIRERLAGTPALDFLVVAGVIVWLAFVRALFITRKHGKLPPGPLKHSLGEMAYRVPPPDDWRVYMEWARIYGMVPRILQVVYH